MFLYDMLRGEVSIETCRSTLNAFTRHGHLRIRSCAHTARGTLSISKVLINAYYEVSESRAVICEVLGRASRLVVGCDTCLAERKP